VEYCDPWLAIDVRAELRSGDIRSLPYRDDSFQAAACVSVLEHSSDPDGARSEIARVLAPGGMAVIGFSVANLLTSALFRWLGDRAKDIHPSGHHEILQALSRRFNLGRVLRLPRLLPIPIGLYVACQCVRR
jgi:ubiquinone/menaquinone biosynthesis C-methylase UbiE